MVKNTSNSTYLCIVKYIVLILMILYIWRAIHQSNIKEGYDNGTEGDYANSTKKPDVSDEDDGCNECKPISTKNKSISGHKLLPVMDPCFNMREVCKQCILLEDHLNSKGKDCMDCCRKHFLTIEALCEEAIGLDKDGKYEDIRDLPEKIRKIIKEFLSKKNKFEIAQEIRKIRKQYMNKYFSAF